MSYTRGTPEIITEICNLSTPKLKKSHIFIHMADCIQIDSML